MSAEVVNLRRVRKATARVEREAEAAANRARHGRTKGERAVQGLEARRAARSLDGALRDATSAHPVVASPDDGG